MKQKKRVLSLLLAVIMTITQLPYSNLGTAKAADGDEAGDAYEYKLLFKETIKNYDSVWNEEKEEYEDVETDTYNYYYAKHPKKVLQGNDVDISFVSVQGKTDTTEPTSEELGNASSAYIYCDDIGLTDQATGRSIYHDTYGNSSINKNYSDFAKDANGKFTDIAGKRIYTLSITPEEYSYQNIETAGDVNIEIEWVSRGANFIEGGFGEKREKVTKDYGVLYAPVYNFAEGVQKVNYIYVYSLKCKSSASNEWNYIYKDWQYNADGQFAYDASTDSGYGTQYRWEVKVLYSYFDNDTYTSEEVELDNYESCLLTVVKSSDYYNSNPVAFLDQNSSPEYVSTNVNTQLVVDAKAADIKLSSTDVVYDETAYDVKYQWSSSTGGEEYKDIEGATNTEYVLKNAPAQMTEYRLTATAYEKKAEGSSEEAKVKGTATYNINMYVSNGESVFSVSDDSTWNEPDNHNLKNVYDAESSSYVSAEEEYSNTQFTANVGDEIALKLGVDVKDKEKYTIESVTLQKCTYVNNEDGSIADTSKWIDVENKASEDGKYSYTTEALKSSDFYYTNAYKSGEETITEYSAFVPKYRYVVIAVNKETNAKCRAEFKAEINEYTGKYQALETIDRTEKTVEGEKDKAVTLKNPAFIITDDNKNALDKFKAAYTWEKYDSVKGDFVEVKATDNLSIKDNVLSIAKYASDCAGTYRLSVSKVRSDGTPVVSDLKSRFIYRLQDKAEEKNADLPTPHAYRSTARSIPASIGEKVELGVKISPETEGYTVTYVWSKNGTVDANQTKDTYSIEQIKESDFGSYECDVTFKKDGNEYTDQVDFIVDKEYGLVINTPEYTLLKNREIGQKAVMSVDTTGSKGNITYRWYKKNTGIDATDYTRVKDADSVDSSFTIDALKAEDFAEYVCVVTNGQNADIRKFRISSIDNTVVTANSVVRATPYTAKRQLGDSVEMRVDSEILDGYTVSYAWTKIIYDGAYSPSSYYYDEYSFSYLSYEELVERADGNSLKIAEIKDTDYGDYVCYAYITDKATGVTESLSNIRFKLVQDGIVVSEDLKLVEEYGRTVDGGANRVGDTVRFGVEDDASGAYTYRWYFVKRIANASGSEEMLSDFVQNMSDTTSVITKTLTENDFGIYHLTVIDKQAGTVAAEYDFDITKYTGKTGLVSIGVLNVFGSELQRNIGEKAEMSVSAFTQRYGETLTYRWFFYDENEQKSVVIDGATSPTYTIDAVNYSDYGRYECEVFDGTEFASITFNLVKRKAGNICSFGYKGGSNMVRNIGEKVTLDPIIMKGSKELSELTYVWTKSNDEGETVLKSHDATYTIDAMTSGDYGTYTIRVYYGSTYMNTSFTLVKPADGIVFDTSSSSTATKGSVEDNYEYDFNNNAIAKSSLVMLPDSKDTMDVTLSAKATAESGRAITYTWERYDVVQQRWIKQTSTSDTCTISGLNYEDAGDRVRCIIQTENGLDKWEYTAEIVGAGFSITKNQYGVSITTENKYAVDGRTVEFTAEPAYEEVFDYTFQWYDYDDDGNLIIVPGETGRTYTSKVTEKDVKNGYKMCPVVYYNVTSKDKLDGIQNQRSNSYSLEVISAAPQKDYPYESVYGDSSVSVQAYKVDGAAKVTYIFDKAYSLGGFAYLNVVDADGKLVDTFGNYEVYDEWEHGIYKEERVTVGNSEDPEKVTVPSDTAYFVFCRKDLYAATNDNMRNNIMKLGYKVANLGTDPGEITIDKTAVTLDAGGSEDISYTIKDMEGNAGKDADISVESSDTSVATAKVQNGKINISVLSSAKGASVATISVKYGNDTKKVKVTVTNPLNKIAASKSSVSVKKGKTVKVSFTVTANNTAAAFNPAITKNDFKYTIGTKYATVSKTSYKTSKGKIVATLTLKAKKKGSTKLAVKVGGKTKKIKIKITK